MDIYNSSCNNSCNNSCNKSISCNNSNHNSSFSDLFYKVIHNKYIFNLIFHHLHSRYDDYNQTTFRYIGEGQYDIQRIRFKDIVSLKFMLENKLYQLLKCKLEANEYINEDTVGKLWLNGIYDQDRELSIEIAKLVLKSTSITNPDDPFRYIHLLNPELIQIATDPSSPHSILVQRDMVDTALNNSTTPQIKALLDSFYDTLYNTNNNNNCTLNTFNQSASSEYINQFKNTIVNLAVEINDPVQRNRALESILSNSKYYNIPPSTSNSINKRIKLSQDSHSTPTINNNNNNNIDSPLDIQLISIQDIVCGVISVDIQNQLLDLNYYYIPESLSTYTDQINNIVNNNNSNNNQLKRSKELLELFRDNGLENSKLINYISSWFYDLGKLQIMVSNNQDDWRGWNIEIEQYINSINLGESKEHSKYYQSLKQIQEFNHINQYIDNRVSEQLSKPQIDYYCQGSNRKKLNYYKHLNIIKRIGSSNDNITKNSLNNKSRIEPLELDIDTIITNINRYSESCSIMDVYNSLSSLITLQYESNSITTTSNQINFGSIDNYQQGNDINSYSQQSTPFRILTCWIYVFITSIRLGSNDRITLLLKLNFNPIVQHHQLFRELWNRHIGWVVRFYFDIPVFEKHYKYGILQLNTQIFKESKEYSERDPNGMVEIIKVLLDNYKQHQHDITVIKQQHQQQFQNMESDEDDQESVRDQYYYVEKEIEIISKLSAPDLVINYLFRMLIQSNGEIQLDTIKSIYKLINDSNIIKVQQSTLFSIYYLSLKSKYFIKYIATSPYLFNVLDFSQENNFEYVYCLDTTQCRIKDDYFLRSMVEFDPSVFIDPQVFTFEFVLLSNNNSFVNTLKALVDRYMVKLFQGQSKKDIDLHDASEIKLLNQVVNHTLSFLLEVREFGLFFNYLEQLKNYDTNYFNQHIQFTNSLFKSIVLAGNQDAFYKLLKEYQPQFNQLLFSDKYDIRINDNISFTFKYYHEINNIIPIAKEPLYTNYILGYPDVVVKNHALLFGDNKITDCKFDSINFNHYSIDQYKLLINQYPNNPVFKLSKNSITQLIQSRSIIKLKQLYQNQLINDQPSDNEEYDKILSYLRSQLKQHNSTPTIIAKTV